MCDRQKDMGGYRKDRIDTASENNILNLESTLIFLTLRMSRILLNTIKYWKY